MVNPKNKKRNSTFTSNTKQKQQKIDSSTNNQPVNEINNNNLFNDLDEEMDAELMEEVIEQLNEEGSESDDNNSLIDSNSVNETEEEEDEEKENNVDNDSDKDSDDDNNSTTYVEQPIIKKDLSAKFRDYYMEKITVAFGSDLDQIRQDPALNTSRLNVLIDSLETGMGVFSDLEKDIMLTEAKK